MEAPFSENHSDVWLRSNSEVGDVGSLDAAAPRRVYLDRDCAIFCLVSPEDYEWVTQWRWGWVWDRTKTKRYARRTPRCAGNGSRTVFLHKEILNRSGKKQLSEAHTIGDHQAGRRKPQQPARQSGMGDGFSKQEKPQAMSRNPNWTPREDATAAALKGAGMSPAVIGERLGRSADAVKRRLGWVRLSAERRAEIGRTKTRNRGKAAPEMRA